MLSAKETLDVAHHEQDDHDDEHQPQTPGRAITPGATVRPGWQGTYQEQHKNNEKDGTEHYCSPCKLPGHGVVPQGLSSTGASNDPGRRKPYSSVRRARFGGAGNRANAAAPVVSTTAITANTDTKG